MRLALKLFCNCKGNSDSKIGDKEEGISVPGQKAEAFCLKMQLTGSNSYH